MSTESTQSEEKNFHFTEPNQDRLLVKAFGLTSEDLAIDFDTVSQPQAVTQILLNCLATSPQQTASENDIWGWSLRSRLQYLIEIALNSSCSTLQFTHHCSDSECGEKIEFDIQLSDFSQLEPGETLSLTLDEKAVEIRLPKGLDQQIWLASPELPLIELVQSLVLSIDQQPVPTDWKIPSAWIAQISDALENADPLMTLTLDLLCPVCGGKNEIDLDLENRLVERLKLTQKSVLHEVHRLASIYHWTEAQIVDLPAWKRQFYLSQIQSDYHGVKRS